MKLCWMLGETSAKLEGVRAALYSETYQWSQTAERIITKIISTHNAIEVKGFTWDYYCVK